MLSSCGSDLLRPSSLCVDGLCVTWLILVSDAPVYLVYLLVGVCPALVVLRVVFTYVYF